MKIIRTFISSDLGAAGRVVGYEACLGAHYATETM